MDLDQLDSTTPLGLEYASQQSAGNNDCQVVELPIIEYAGSRVDQSSRVADNRMAQYWPYERVVVGDGAYSMSRRTGECL